MKNFRDSEKKTVDKLRKKRKIEEGVNATQISSKTESRNPVVGIFISNIPKEIKIKMIRNQLSSIQA